MESYFISEFVKNEEKIFEYALRTNVIPPIKGKITKGKIKWRGIRIVQTIEFCNFTRWLEQRGKIISPKIKYEILK